MNKKNNNKGFTLAELLIVVAIIAVLVAIAIPVFTSQLEKSREATDIANVRSAYANVVTEYLENQSANSMTVAARQTIADWQGDSGTLVYQVGGKEESLNYSAATKGGSYEVKIQNSGTGKNATAKVTVTAS